METKWHLSFIQFLFTLTNIQIQIIYNFILTKKEAQ